MQANGRVDLTELPEALVVYDGQTEHSVPLDQFVFECEKLEAQHKDADGLTMFNAIGDLLVRLVPALKTCFATSRRVRARQALAIWQKATTILEEYEKNLSPGSGSSTTSQEQTGAGQARQPSRSPTVPSNA